MALSIDINGSVSSAVATMARGMRAVANWLTLRHLEQFEELQIDATAKQPLNLYPLGRVE